MATNGSKPSVKLIDNTQGEINTYLEGLGWTFTNQKDSTYGNVTNMPTTQCPVMTDHLVALVYDVLIYAQNKERGKHYQMLIEQKTFLDPEDFLNEKCGFVKVDGPMSHFSMMMKLEL